MRYYAKATFGQVEFTAPTAAERDALVDRVKAFFAEIGTVAIIQTGVTNDVKDESGNVVGTITVAD